MPHRGLTFTESVAQAEGLDVPKDSNERRVFVIGASSMMGYHHFGQASLSQALTYILNHSAPDHHWKVVSFAKAGEGSPFVFQTARESLRYRPDLLLLYVGENEFSPIPVLGRQWPYRLEAFLLKSKLFRIGREIVHRSPWPTAPDFSKVGWGDFYNRVQLNRDRIMADFVREGVSFLKDRPTGIAVVFLQPILSAPSGPAFWNELEKWQLDWSLPATRDFARGVLAAEDGKPNEAIGFFKRAEAAQPNFVLTPQYLSISLRTLGRTQEAETARQKAIDLDISPPQLPKENYENVLQGAPLAEMIPLASRVASRRGTARVPEDLIEDGCHPTVQLEFEEAREILEDPLVRRTLGYANDPLRMSFDGYAGAQKLDKAFFMQVYSHIGWYLIRSPTAKTAFLKALSFSSGNPEVLKALNTYEEHNAMRLDLRKRVLADWRSHLQNSKW